jgi:hypothetical protein
MKQLSTSSILNIYKSITFTQKIIKYRLYGGFKIIFEIVTSFKCEIIALLINSKFGVGIIILWAKT